VRRSNVQRAVDAVSRSNAEAASQARKSERKWWLQQLAKLVGEANDLHGPGAVVSTSSLIGLSNKRTGDKI
jgi:hypothetical protein